MFWAAASFFSCYIKWFFWSIDVTVNLSSETGVDLTLEFEDSELYQHFETFYYDILPEFKSIGRVVQLKVCCNYEPHLRGNVYVQYSR